MKWGPTLLMHTICTPEDFVQAMNSRQNLKPLQKNTGLIKKNTFGVVLLTMFIVVILFRKHWSTSAMKESIQWSSSRCIRNTFPASKDE